MSGCALNRAAERDLESALREHEQQRGRDAGAYARIGGRSAR